MLAKTTFMSSNASRCNSQFHERVASMMAKSLITMSQYFAKNCSRPLFLFRLVNSFILSSRFNTDKREFILVHACLKCMCSLAWIESLANLIVSTISLLISSFFQSVYHSNVSCRIKMFISSYVASCVGISLIMLEQSLT